MVKTRVVVSARLANATSNVAEPCAMCIDPSKSAVSGDGVEVRLEVGLPARGRSVLGRQAAQLLCQDVPAYVRRALAHAPQEQQVMHTTAAAAAAAGPLLDSMGGEGIEVSLLIKRIMQQVYVMRHCGIQKCTHISITNPATRGQSRSRAPTNQVRSVQ